MYLNVYKLHWLSLEKITFHGKKEGNTKNLELGPYSPNTI